VKEGNDMEKKSKKELLAAYKERKIVGGICAIKNTVNGKQLISAVTDLQGSKNRYEFSRATGGCLDLRIQKDWEEYGNEAFTFVILEELEKKDTQTMKEFEEDIKMLKDILLEKLDPNMIY
jgi:hypothetical protein